MDGENKTAIAYLFGGDKAASLPGLSVDLAPVFDE